MRRKAEREAGEEKLREEKPALKIPSRKESAPEADSEGTGGSSDLDEQRKRREERKAAARESAAKAEKQTAKAAEATKSVNSAPASAASTAERSPEETRARTIVDSSKKIISTYKQPSGYTVDLSLAKATVDAAESLLAKGRYDEALEKAGAVGMQVGMLEIRAGIEKDLDELKSNPKYADKISPVRSTLDEADQLMAEARKRFTDAADAEPKFMGLMQQAMAKTMKAMGEANAIKLS